MSAFTRFLTLGCFVVLGHSVAFAQGCPGGSCSITCPPDVSLCLAPDNYGQTALTAAWVASYTSSPDPNCSVTRVWKDAMGMEELTTPIWVDCDDVGDHIDLWVTREKPLWVECRSSFVKVRVHFKDCEPPAIACPPMGMYVCNANVPRPGTSLPFPLNLVYPGYKLISQATFQSLGGSASDACGLDGVVYKDDLISTDPFCKTNRTIKRTFVVFDINGNSKSCTQDIVVADNVPPTFTDNPGDLLIPCDADASTMIAAITAWLGKNTNPGDQSGQDAVVVDGCSENMVMITAVPGNATTIINQMPNACDPNPREVIVVFTADDGCGNQATRSARVRLIDNVEPTVPPIPNSFYTCASQVPPAPNFGVVDGEYDNCTPSQKLKIELISDQFTYNGCPDKFTEVRVYRITDCDGNYKDRSHTIIVNDNVNPYWNPAPQPLFLMDVCNPADLETQIQGWMNQNGYGIAKDDCGNPQVTVNKTAVDVAQFLRRFCDTPGNNTRSTVVTFTATDACGNSRTATATVRLMDTQPPSGTAPPTATYDCPDDVPQMLASQVTFLTDNCSEGNTVLVAIENNPAPLPGCKGYPNIIIRKWRLTDCAGNTSYVTQMIKVQDETAPNWTNLPDDFDLDCTDGGLNTKLHDWLTNIGGSSAALDACDGSNVKYSADPPSVNAILNALGPCAPKAGTTVVTFYAEDQCGNRKSATATVRIRDLAPPTATRVETTYSCPGQVPPPNPAVISDEADVCSPNPPTVVFLPNATTNNGGTGCMGNPLVITRWYLLTDCSGNTSSQSHRITVVDMTAPQALCQALTRSLDANGQVMVNASEFDNGSFDNCGIKKIEIRRGASGPWFDKLTFDCADIPDIPNCGAFVENSFIWSIQVRVTDNCDQTDICTTTITIKDEEPPTIQCPDDMTFYTDNDGGYDCIANANWTHPSPHDNCSVQCMTMEVQKEINGVFVTINPANGFPSPNFETNVIGQAGQPVSYPFGKGPYCDDNEYKIIYRVRDEHGNNKPGVMCMFKITIKDNEAPQWKDCPEDPIVAQTVTGDCYQMKCWKRPTPYDNCEYPTGPCPAPTVVVTVSDPTVMVNQVGDEDCALFPVGRTVVTYTATDAEGNVSTCTVEVLISDPENPVAMCAGPFTVNMEPDGVMQLSIADIDAPGTMDNCGICFKGISRNPNCCFGPTVTLTCDDVGKTVAVTMLVKDCSQPVANEAKCTAMVTVQDMQSPGPAYCPADIEIGTDPGVCTAVVTYTIPTFNDGCNSPHNGTLVSPVWAVPGATFPIGNTTVTYSYTSLSGYTVYCNFVVTVVDDENPNIVCPANVTNLTCQQMLPAPLTAGAFTGGTLTDNCGVSALESSDYSDGFTACNNDPVHTVVRTYVAFDAAGNSSTCSQSFTYIEDNVAPIFTVAGLGVIPPGVEEFSCVNCLNGKCAGDVPPVPTVTANDGTGCDGVTIDYEVIIQNLNNSGEPECTNKFRMIRSWVASDVCGNTRYLSEVIVVNDDVKPALASKPGDMSLQCIDDVPAAPTIGATDNCGYVTVDFFETQDQGPVSCPNSTVIRRTWTATDACGNTDQHTQTITVNDTTRPVLSNLPTATLAFNCATDVPAVANVTGSDNCDVVFVDFSEITDPGSCQNSFVVIRTWRATDACGNTTAFTQTITVNDAINPFFTNVPGNQSVSCAAQVPALVHPTANDNCGQVNVDFAEYEIPGDCPNHYSVVRRWVATDLCGNQAVTTQVITVNDTEAPVFTSTPDAVVNKACAQEVPAAAVLTATDNCDGPVTVFYSEELRPGDCGNRFSIVRTWTAEDLCSNVVRFTQTINVNDILAPTWNEMAPANPTVECSQQVPAVPVQTAVDNCGVPVFIDFSEVEIPGTCSNQYQVVRTWIATDDCGNSTKRVQTVTVSDIIAPVLTNLPVATFTTDCAEKVPAMPNPAVGATDNCGQPIDVYFAEVEIPGTCSNQYQITRTWRAQDDCGNATVFVQTITINDSQAPVLANLPDAVVNVECAQQVPAVAAVTASDNCNKPIDFDFTEVEIPGDCPNKYVIKRTWTAADDCGNATTFVQTITINDTKAPVFAGLPPATVNVVCASDVPAVANVTASDNCGAPVDVELSEVEIPGICVNKYTITRTWTAEDDCGNITTFVQTINVNDNVPPELYAKPLRRHYDCIEDVEIAPYQFATDNCGVATVEFSETENPGNCPNWTVIERRWVAYDLCGNSSTWEQIIDVRDTIAPVLTITPVDRTFECFDEVPSAPLGLGATDNCGVAFVDYSESTEGGALGDPNWSCPNKVVVTRRWVAFDLCGNTAEHIQTITVFDDIPPAFVVTPVDRTYECLEDVPPAPTEGVIAQDNCEVVFVDFLETTDNDVCQNQVIIKRKWEATDACGNKNTHWQTLTVYDDKAPVLANLPAATVNVECSEQVPAKAAVTATDNCGAAFDFDFTEVEVPGTCPNQYQIIRTWTAEDVCSNFTSFVQTITVSDTKAPVWTSPLPGNLSLQCGETVPPAATLTASDNCNAPVDIELSETTLPGSGPNDGGKIVRTWTAEDDCGNATTHVQTITINDIEAPVLVGTPAATVNVQCSEQVPAVANVTATDNCQGTVDVELVEIEIPGTCPNQYVITRTWTAVDFAGNSTIFVQTITVFDNVAPVLAGLPAATVNVSCSENVPALANVTATDNCNAPVDVEISEIEIPGTCANQYTVKRTWTAEDDCGNITTFVQTINVSDTQAPVLAGLPAATVNVSCSENVPALANVTATDNCNAPVDVEISEIEIPGTCPNQYSITRTWTAEDDCGNITTFVQTINVSDTQAPVFAGLPAATVNVECSEQVPALANVTATDNCNAPVDVEISEIEIPGTCANQYVVKRTWTAEDDCGNITTFVQTITVSDTKAPVFNTPLPPATLTLQCGETVPPAATLTATDNCNAPVDVELSETFLPGSGPNDGGKIVRTWTAEDDCGNITTYVQTITIDDTQAPVLVGTPAATVNVSCSEQVPAVANVTATDNCQGTVDVELVEIEIPGTCANQYTVTRTWTAVDFAGNSTIFVQTINVFDNVAPVFNAPLPSDLSLQCGEAVPPAATLTATDNCNAPVDVELSETYLPGSGPNDGGKIVRTWTAEDDCGNATSYVQTITIGDSEAPVLVGLPDETVNVECSEDVPAAAVVTATDNCQGTVDLDFNETILLGNCINQYTMTRTWTATDFAGNSTFFVQTINVNDTEAPTWDQDAPANADVKCAADVPVLPVQTATDNCGVPVIVDFSETVQPGSCLNKFTLIRTWHVQDDCGNATSRQQIINVNDDVAPVMSCPAPLQAQCSPGEYPPYANLTEFEAAGGSASDNCGLNVNSFGMMSEVKNGNVYTRTYRVIDQCGNTTTCTQTVTVIDTQKPIFLNCPAGPLVFGNDPDKCSAKIDWPNPVAVDNCSIPTVVQTSGPTSGSIVPVGTYTVVFTATDAAGNVATCSFTVMVMDTQLPEFDFDILMPGDITVECDAVPAPFVLTNNDVHDNCTPSNLLVITYKADTTNIICKNSFTITRTWTVTDQALNTLIHTQKITVRDTKKPTALCKNATVTLDKFGAATIIASQINNGSFDNCATQADLTFAVTPSAFTCANLGNNIVTLTVTDACGNSATCTATVTVLQGIGPCTPQFTVKTTCKDNATTLDNGQFEDLITIKSLAMQTWTLSTNTGLYSTASPAPPAAPVALAVGTTFTAGTADGIDNDGDGQIDEADEMVYYTLKGIHVDAIGYSIQLKNNLNQTGTISNKGYYPSPYFINLNDPFCLNTPPFTILVGEYNNAVPTSIVITINGVTTSTFNAAALGIGFHTVMATFDAGTPTTNLVINGQLVGGTDAQALADPGCKQKITKIVQITNTPTTVVCNDLVHISIHNDGGDCVFLIAPDDVLEGGYLCDDDYSVVLTYPNGTHTFNPPNKVDYTHIGKKLKYTLVHAISGNTCWGEVLVEDKEPPVLTCPGDITIKCSDPTDVNFTGKLLFDDCNPVVTIVDTDDYTDFGSCATPWRAQIIRTWLATDGSGNQSTCSQRIRIAPFSLSDVEWPKDVSIECSDVNSTDPNVTGLPSINGSPIGTGGLCMASISKTDEYYDICPGSYEIIRTWKVRNMCLPVGPGNPIEHAQVIKITDTHGPAFDCPGDITVSTDPFACCATAPLPDMIITESCSHVTSLTYKVVGIDENTGNLVIHEGSGYLADFPGNNHWTPDTLGVFGFSQCLPRGVYTVTYTAIDGCENVTKCTFKLTVEDQIPPISACDEFTQVALGGDGTAYVNASTFNDGSYDVCNPVSFKARRMNDNDCQDNDYFYDQVKFCCDDINDTVLVVFRVYDFPAQAGPVELDYGQGHWNDCMVQVFVEDKIKPTCVAPANVTVSCENFDPSLWAYGFATAADNCCIDTITATASYTLFDTVCNRGTITRTFRSFDCGGQSNQCTQRVFVNYNQNYFVKFPNDVIVTVCDGTGNYGEPTFFGKDCELLGVSHEDEVFTVVPDACYKIERTWTIINWCTYNPNAGCIEVPNPNPNSITNHPSNLPGPTVSAPGTPAPWAPTVVAILPGQTPTNYSVYWAANANCYKYKQIIKVIDTQKPIIENCPASPVEVCDVTPNAADLWNESYWYDSKINSHDLCEGPTDLTITATDLCSGAAVNVRYLLFLDLDGDGSMETVISSTNLPGFNNVYFGNAANPNFSGGSPRQFDERLVPFNQKYGFAIQTTTAGTKKTASVRWNTQQSPNNYVVPELPYGTHKIKWIVDDGCGNEQVCEYTFVVKDCKAPTVVCLNGLSVNIMPTKMITLWASDFLQYTEDNCTPSGQIVIAIRKSGTGTGFPLNPDGTPQTSVTFTCDELGTQLVELWGIDKAGNADYCETYVIVQDNAGYCSGNNGTVAGDLKTETDKGLEDASVELDGTSNALPPTSMFDFSDNTGHYDFNGVPYLGDYTVTPTKDNDPLNGVSTFDLVLINKHILGLEPLNSPYKMIAADANNSRSVTTFDIVELRKLILGIYTELPNNTSWRFVDGVYNFPNPSNPFQEIFPETKQIADMQISMLDQDFVSVKVGDVNGNAVTNSLTSLDDRTDGTLLFDVQDRAVKAGETFTVNFKAAERVTGYQFTLYFPNLEVVDVTAGADMKLENFGIFNSEHALTTSFDNERAIGEFSVTFRSKASGTLNQMLAVSSRITKAEAYDLNRERQAVALRFNGQNGSTVTGLGFELYQNQPNPWMTKTQIGFYLPEATEATLTIFDETGRTLFTQNGEFGKGYNAIPVDRALVNTTGVLYYKLETTNDSAVKKMIQTK